jgi:hypothetical protein
MMFSVNPTNSREALLADALIRCCSHYLVYEEGAPAPQNVPHAYNDLFDAVRAVPPAYFPEPIDEAFDAIYAAQDQPECKISLPNFLVEPLNLQGLFFFVFAECHPDCPNCASTVMHLPRAMRVSLHCAKMTLHHLFPDHTYCECTFREAE